MKGTHIKTIFFGILFVPSFLFVTSLQSQNLLQEKIFVHTAKSSFHAGESMWFSIYVMDASNGTISALSKIVFAEMLDSLNVPVWQGVIRLDKGRGQGSFVIPDVAPGVMKFRAYTNWMKNFSSECYFQKSIAVANARVADKTFLKSDDQNDSSIDDGLTIRVNTDKRTYGKRRKVTIALETSAEKETKVAADLSLSVYRLDSFTNVDLSGFKSGIPTSIPAPASIDYPLEYREQWVSGKVMASDSAPAPAGLNVFLTVPGYSSGFYNGLTDSSGRFRIAVRDPVPAGYMLIQHEDKFENTYNITLETPYSTNPPSTGNDKYSMIRSGNALTEASINAQVELLYQSADKLSYYPVHYDTIPFYGKADFVYNLDDYTRFSKMEEVFREYIAPVAVSKNGDLFQFHVYELQTHQPFPTPPLVLLDGYPVMDINALFLFDPLKVKTVEVINRKYIYGSTTYNGVVNMITYSHDLNGFAPSKNTVVSTHQAIQPVRRFVAPAYDDSTSQKERFPDFRTVLYWSPSIKTLLTGKADISFYTSDLEGEFVAVVHGITAEGKTGSSFVKFTVGEDE